MKLDSYFRPELRHYLYTPVRLSRVHKFRMHTSVTYYLLYHQDGEQSAFYFKHMNASLGSVVLHW
jgi:hypothetical protein